MSDVLNSGLRRQFTIAHELGHFLLHTVGDDQLSCCVDENIDDLDRRRVEREANRFAAEFLMPHGRWSDAARVPAPDMTVVRGLAADYQVSLTTAAIRFVELAPSRCAVVFCRDLRMKWSAESPRLGYRFVKGTPVTPASLAWGYLEGHPMPDWPTRVPATAWLRVAGRKREAELIEHCVPMAVQHAALSMLVLPPNSGL